MMSLYHYLMSLCFQQFDCLLDCSVLCVDMIELYIFWLSSVFISLKKIYEIKFLFLDQTFSFTYLFACQAVCVRVGKGSFCQSSY